MYGFSNIMYYLYSQYNFDMNYRDVFLCIYFSNNNTTLLRLGCKQYITVGYIHNNS